jgi:hypothetical protein
METSVELGGFAIWNISNSDGNFVELRGLPSGIFQTGWKLLLN